MNFLEKIINKFPIADYPSFSRVHPLLSFNTTGLQCYVKRDDELGCGISGSKIRKYSSLIPQILRQKIDEAIVIGGANSNHVLGVSQLLIENGIKPVLFLCSNRAETKQKEFKGNALLIQLLVPEEQIFWITKNQWPQVREIATDYSEQHADKKIFIIPEGGLMPESLPGALTLPKDILRNEEQQDIQFQHIFVDSGTGMTAIALILGLAFVQHTGHIHVVQMADDEQIFLELLKKYHHHFFSLFQQECPYPKNFSLNKPHQAKAFGATNSSTFKAIKDLAREEGILCDPIYNAKLFLESKRKIVEEKLQGNALIIQSGGTLSLTGFL